jgi:hypothetical protein
VAFSRRNVKKRYATRKHGPMSRNRRFKRQSMKNYMIKVHSEKLISYSPEEKIRFDSIDLKEDSHQ